MGGTLSSQSAHQKAETKFNTLLHYADSAIKYANYSTLETFTTDGVKMLALAYQASEAPHACSQNQHLRFALSKDGARKLKQASLLHFPTGWECFFEKQRCLHLPGHEARYTSPGVCAPSG